MIGADFRERDREKEWRGRDSSMQNMMQLHPINLSIYLCVSEDAVR